MKIENYCSDKKGTLFNLKVNFKSFSSYSLLKYKKNFSSEYR